MNTTTDEFWGGTFGDQYTARNRVDWEARVPFWQRIQALTKATFVMEVGTNAGWNMRAWHQAHKDSCIFGSDINAGALQEAAEAGLSVTPDPAVMIGKYYPNTFDLVFTAGVLIHIPPEDLQAVMESIAKASYRYVLAVEYESDREEEINYRGHAGRLWKRPYGKLYEAMGLELVASGDPGPAFDRCTYTLLRKS